jgi:hypothetical protein
LPSNEFLTENGFRRIAPLPLQSITNKDRLCE